VTQNLRPEKGTPRLSDWLTAADSGRYFLPGLQALVRFPLVQARLDRAAGLRIAAFIGGYPGSPLSGYDLALSRIPDGLADHDVTFVPAGNEELASTAHMGIQMLDEHPARRLGRHNRYLARQGTGRRPQRRRPQARQLRRHIHHGAVVIRYDVM
jgi:indolepyruvate ferredoxin oxidoreductase